MLFSKQQSAKSESSVCKDSLLSEHTDPFLIHIIPCYFHWEIKSLTVIACQGAPRTIKMPSMSQLLPVLSVALSRVLTPNKSGSKFMDKTTEYCTPLSIVHSCLHCLHIVPSQMALGGKTVKPQVKGGPYHWWCHCYKIMCKLQPSEVGSALCMHPAYKDLIIPQPTPS